MPSRNRKKRSEQRAEYLQRQDDILSQENKAKARARYKADPEKKKASVRDSYKADPELKKASVRDSYKVDPEKKKASVRDSYNADIESKQSAKRQRYQEAVLPRYIAKCDISRLNLYIAINIYSFRGDFHHTCLRESAQLNRLKRPNTGNLKVKSRMPVIW